MWNRDNESRVGRMNDKQLLEEVRKAFSVANDAKRQRQFENSLHFTSMMLYIEKELMTFLQNNIKDNTNEQPTLD